MTTLTLEPKDYCPIPPLREMHVLTEAERGSLAAENIRRCRAFAATPPEKRDWPPKEAAPQRVQAHLHHLKPVPLRTAFKRIA